MASNDEKERDAAIAEARDLGLQRPWEWSIDKTPHAQDAIANLVLKTWESSRKHRDLQIVDALTEKHMAAWDTCDFHKAIGNYIDELREGTK